MDAISMVSRIAIKLGTVSLPAVPHDETQAPSRVKTSRLPSFNHLSLPLIISRSKTIN
jgi:hypothetical protein